jgi:putative SOS response-associated peptidase YedK
MCGRFALWSTGKSIPSFKGSYNISSGMLTPVLVKESPVKIKLLKWGIGKGIINARSEGIDKKYIFKDLISKNRCLILANGFFEWKSINLEGKEEKIPWFFKLKNKSMFFLAGIYDEKGNYAIITTSPNKVIENIHNRMPVIISENDGDNWLEKNTKLSVALSLLKPFEDDKMIGYPVSKEVNNPKNDYPSLIEKV